MYVPVKAVSTKEFPAQRRHLKINTCITFGAIFKEFCKMFSWVRQDIGDTTHWTKAKWFSIFAICGPLK